MLLTHSTSKIVKLLLLVSLVLLASASFPSFATEEVDGLSILTVTDGENGSEYSVKLQILILMTMLSFVPAFIIMCTSFTRIIIVLAVLRQALGLQQSPPNQVLIGIALILSALIMRPVWSEIYEDAYLPYEAGEMTLVQTLQTAEKPLRSYMLAQTQKSSLTQMLKIAREPAATPVEEVPFLVLLPAYVISELKVAFQIGFMLFLPFLVIDLVTASVLMSMGMMMLSPLIVSLPFKLLVFVVVDGWDMLVGSLAASFAMG